jgi:hypothetical protein
MQRRVVRELVILAVRLETEAHRASPQVIPALTSRTVFQEAQAAAPWAVVVVRLHLD